MFFGVDESEIRETIDEQITTFINEAYYTYPKEYRQSEEYRALSIDQKFQDAIKRLGLDRFKELITDKIIDYYL
jgi:hypothetical protein